MSETTASAQAGGAKSSTDGTEPPGGPNPDDEDEGIKRVNITINSARHEKLSDFAEERGLSFSGFVRRGAEELRHRLEDDGTDRELQPILGELDRQQETLDEFKAGEFEVLVSTSVAEEGLDVPEVDLVCFYEPVPTAIRSSSRYWPIRLMADVIFSISSEPASAERLAAEESSFASAACPALLLDMADSSSSEALTS